MNFRYEKIKLDQGYDFVIGCDEVGKGCLAGPVVSAVVIFSPELGIRKNELREVKDSKLLSPKKRERLSAIIKDRAVAWSIGEADSSKIDEINIHYASLLSMKRALEKLDQKYLSKTSLLAIDGSFKVPAIDLIQEAIVDGDNKILSIAAASIIAKVYRDDLMRKMHGQYPRFSFDKHKGYATVLHRRMILRHGLCEIHRRSFCSNYISETKI